MLKKRLKLYKFFIVLVLGFLVCDCCVYANQQSSKKSSTTVDYVFIGDSRFVGTSSVIHGWSTESGEIIKTADNEHWICKSGTSLSAYKSTIKRELKKYKKNHTVIVYELGVNALTEIDSDIAFVKELEAEGWNVYYCDMLPINDSIFQHYSTFPNESIVQEQNEKIYNSGLKVVYFHDTCYENYIDKTDDGLHYYREVYQQWYDQIKIQTHYLSEITNAQNEQIQYELTEILGKFDDTTETVIKESELVELNKRTTVTANVGMLDTQTEVQTLAMSINVGEQEPKENEVTVTDNQQVEVVSEQNQSANSSDSNSYLSRIPSNVMNHLYASGWTVEFIDDGTLQTIGGYSFHILALTVHDEKKIYVSKNNPSAVLHEIGHAVDQELGFPATNDTSTVGVYQEEVGSFCNNFPTHSNNIATSHEYYAEAFECYIKNGGKLSQSCPGTYGVIASWISSM